MEINKPQIPKIAKLPEATSVLSEEQERLRRISSYQDFVINCFMFPRQRHFSSNQYRYGFQLGGEYLLSWAKDLLAQQDDKELHSKVKVIRTLLNSAVEKEKTSQGRTMGHLDSHMVLDETIFQKQMEALEDFEILLKQKTAQFFPSPKKTSSDKKAAY